MRGIVKGEGEIRGGNLHFYKELASSFARGTLAFHAVALDGGKEELLL